jgi:predicted peroxiredoxin
MTGKFRKSLIVSGILALAPMFHAQDAAAQAAGAIDASALEIDAGALTGAGTMGSAATAIAAARAGAITATVTDPDCLLIHGTTGPENATRAALAFTVARAAADDGRRVRVFLAGDGALLLRDAVLDNLVGVGTGKLREAYDGIVAKGGKFYVSGMSAKARGMTEADFAGKQVTLAMPTVLTRLAYECSRTITY